MSQRATIDAFLEPLPTLGGAPLFDVRTPAEFARGHIPGAHNLPLFSDEERAVIGTLYKQRGRHEAMLQGLDLIGPRMRAMVEQVERIVGMSPEEYSGPPLRVHCWRGGMRSGSVAWLLSFYGYPCVVLDGGYKAFRRHVLDTFERETLTYLIVGGPTGSKKTELLAALAAHGEQTIDLEALANHRGSAFGHLLLDEQPSVEHFENMLAMALRACDPARPVWLEDESRLIGSVVLPSPFYQAMQRSKTFVIEIPLEERVAHLVKLYGKAKKRALVDAFTGIRKKLGGKKFTDALDALDERRLDQAAAIAITYYDKAYAHALGKREGSGIEHISFARKEATPGASHEDSGVVLGARASALISRAAMAE